MENQYLSVVILYLNFHMAQVNDKGNEQYK